MSRYFLRTLRLKLVLMTPNKHPIRYLRRWAIALVVVALYLGGAAAVGATESPAAGQLIHRSIPQKGDTTHVVVPGERFKAGRLQQWIYGRNYRPLWTMPIEVPVLDLDAVGGGLSPMRTGGFGQSVSLHFMGEDGRRYTVRSLDKDPSKRLLTELKQTVVEDAIQDLISAQLPAGALVVDALMEATGILHAPHRLVVIPDDPRLGAYRQEFAGLIGTLQEHPSEAADDEPGFAGSRKVSGTEKVYQRLEKTPCERVDARAYLKARLVDFLVGDKDRHSGQWRWARFPVGDCYTWLPIPEDRDQAFIDFDGLLMELVRQVDPKFVRFQAHYPDHRGLPRNGWEVDRELLAELEWSAWDSVVTTVQAELPDLVIEGAVRRLPEPYYEQVGAFLARALKTRRDQLDEFAAQYYGLISREVEIKGTDEDEYLELEHREDGALEVRIGLAGPPHAPYFRRTLYPGETKEVRIYLHGGDDQVAILGEWAKIRVRVDGGGGDDTYANHSRAGRRMTRFYDARGKNRFDGGAALMDERPYKRPAPTGASTDRYVVDWGQETLALPVVSYSPDLGVYAGLFHARIYHGYRKNPYASKHALGLGVAPGAKVRPLVTYSGAFRHLLGGLDGRLHLEYSGIEVIRFNGFGNGVAIPRPESFYEVEQTQFSFAPALSWSPGTWTLTGGPLVQFTKTPLADNKGTFIAGYETPLYGMEDFGQVGVGGELAYDTRDNPGHARRGLRLGLRGALYPKLWDVKSTFGRVAGDAAVYLSADLPTLPTLALRVGGEIVRGAFPFHEAATVGGPDDLRGFYEDRFAGEAALYGNGELWLRLTRLWFPLPGELGAFAAVDVGRVFYNADPEEADGWHIGTGGGLWVAFLQRRATLSAALMDGEDRIGAYLRTGMMF